MLSDKTVQTSLTLLLAVSGATLGGCSARVTEGNAPDTSAWLPEDGKADSATSRELSTANFVGYLRGCEATYTTATENDIDLADDMSREWWLLECYGRANNWAAPLLQTRVDALQQTEVTRPVADIFTAHRSALRTLCETHAAIVPEASQAEYVYGCYGSIERDLANAIVLTDAHFDDAALGDTQIAIPEEELMQIHDAASECYAVALEGVEVTETTVLDVTQMETLAQCLTESLLAYGANIASVAADDPQAAQYVSQVFAAAQTSYEEFAGLIAVAASYDYVAAEQEFDAASARNDTLLFQMLRGFHMAALAFTYQNQEPVDSDATLPAS